MTTLSRHTAMTALSRSPAPIDPAEKGIWRTASSSSLSGLRRIPSLVDFQLHLAETQAAIQSDSSDEEDGEEEMEQRDVAAREYARQMSEAVLRHQQGTARPNTNLQETEDEGEPIASTSNSVRTSAYSSRATSRATSRNVSRAVSRETSPTRRRDLTLDLSGEIFTSRAVKFSGNHIVSLHVGTTSLVLTQSLLVTVQLSQSVLRLPILNATRLVRHPSTAQQPSAEARSHPYSHLPRRTPIPRPPSADQTTNRPPHPSNSRHHRAQELSTAQIGSTEAETGDPLD